MGKETSLRNFRSSFSKQGVDSSVVRHTGLVIMTRNLQASPLLLPWISETTWRHGDGVTTETCIGTQEKQDQIQIVSTRRDPLYLWETEAQRLWPCPQRGLCMQHTLLHNKATWEQFSESWLMMTYVLPNWPCELALLMCAERFLHLCGRFLINIKAEFQGSFLSFSLSLFCSVPS